MSAVPKPKQGQRSWTDAQRTEQAQKLRTRKIWLASTGPRTVDGKLKSSQNARGAHYIERQEIKTINRYLRTQKSYIELIRFYTKQEDRLSSCAKNLMEMRLDFFENELIDLEHQIFGGVRFSDIMSGKIIPFPAPPPT